MTKVRVLYFAALRERLGVGEEELELPADADVAMLLAALRDRHEVLRGLKGFRVAVNQRFSKEADAVPDGAEVALIPPVAGGAPEGPRVHVALTREPIRADALIARVDHPEAGAQAVFLGVVRDHHRGRAVARMEYEAYEAMAVSELQGVADKLLAQHPDVRGVALEHRFGALEIGEASVGVAVSSPHRKESFVACQWGIDTIKERVPIWKKEHYVEGDHHWVRADEMGERETEGAAQEKPE